MIRGGENMNMFEQIKMETESLDIFEEEEPDYFAVSYLLNFLDVLQEKQLIKTPEGKELQKKVLKYADKLAPFVKGPPSGETDWWWHIDKVVKDNLKPGDDDHPTAQGWEWYFLCLVWNIIFR